MRRQRLRSRAAPGRGPLHRASPDAAPRPGLALLRPTAGRHSWVPHPGATGVARRHGIPPPSSCAPGLACRLLDRYRRPPAGTGRGRQRTMPRSATTTIARHGQGD
ncbi:hypothetical protein N5C88_15240 [Achromobacter sp. GD03932]|nr:hypothetical protein [Achromobacter sp. GD03932]